MVHKNVPQFAAAVTLATENSKEAFQVVDQKYVDVEALRLVVDYDKTGFDPRKVHHLLSPEDLQVRLDLLDALQQYASTLADVSGDAKLQEFDSQTKALGTSLQKLTSDPSFQKLVSSTKTDMSIATTAVNALGRWFIEKKRQKELPGLIEQMQGPVKATSDLLRADIGSRPGEDGKGGNGLRAQLWNEYMQGMIEQSAFIDHNKDRLDPGAKSIEIRKLYQLVDERNRADNALRQTAESMSKLVTAHQEILRAVQGKTDLHADISALISEGQRIKTFYESLSK
jgi:hypothetical protein